MISWIIKDEKDIYDTNKCINRLAFQTKLLLMMMERQFNSLHSGTFILYIQYIEKVLTVFT
jgi:hypothetical protein